MTTTPATTALTPREREIVALAAAGRTNDQIAEELGITRNAVRFHLKEVHSKLETGGDRSRLRQLGAFVPAGIGLLKAAAGHGVLSVAAIGAAAAGMAGIAFVVYPGSASAEPPLVDGKYPNGCPDAYSSWPGATWDDFAAIAGKPVAKVRAMNPAIGDPLPADAEVRVGYRPNNTCAEAQPTRS